MESCDGRYESGSEEVTFGVRRQSEAATALWIISSTNSLDPVRGRRFALPAHSISIDLSRRCENTVSCSNQNSRRFSGRDV